MDKISGIIKSSPRVQAVDIRESSAIRPGTPSFGRPEGVSSLAKPEMDLQLSAAKRASAVSDELAGWKAKDQMRASIAAELSNKFFSRAPVEGEELAVASSPKSLPVPVSEIASNPAGFKTDSVGSFRVKTYLAMPSKTMNFNALPDPGPVMAQPEGLFPRGSFIDRIA